jgi:hypothetical protein
MAKSAADTDLARLPWELVDRLTKPFARFLRIEAAARPNNCLNRNRVISPFLWKDFLPLAPAAWNRS